MLIGRFSALALLLLVACSSSKSSSPSGTANPNGSQPLSLPSNGMSLSIAIDVAPKSETHKCRFVKVSEALGAHVGTMRHSYTPGSHHVVLFRTDLTEIPAGSGDVIDCYAGNDVMIHARGIVYASQVPTGEVVMPAGVGLPVHAGEVMLLQAHYLNAGGATLSASAEVQLLGADEASVKEDAGVIFFYDPFIFVPGAGKGSALMRCSIPKDVELFTGFSHMHKRGTGFAAFLDGTDGAMATDPFYRSTDWDHPEGLSAPLAVKAGQGIRFRCDYQNSPDSSDVFQGQSADTNEMCVFTALYHPAMTQNDDLCVGHADMVGGGDKKCSEALSCIQSCPAGSAPKLGGGLAAALNVHPCWQKCMATACPTASKALLAQLGCLRKNCATDCADSSSSTCVSCVANNCANEYTTCSSNTCE